MFLRAEALLEIQWLILAMSDKRPARLPVPSETGPAPRVQRYSVAAFCRNFLAKRGTYLPPVITHRPTRLLPGMRTPLTPAYDAAVDEIALHVGTFDNPAELKPQYNYGSAQRLSWVCCGVALPHRNTEERW